MNISGYALTLSRLPIVIVPLLILPLSGFLAHAVNKKNSDNKKLAARAASIHERIVAGEFLGCISLARVAAEEAHLSGDYARERGFLNNAGICQIPLLQFRNALDSLVKVRKLAELAKDRAALAVVNANISSIYYQMGNFADAEETGNAALTYQDAMKPQQRASLLSHLGNVKAETGRIEGAEPLFQEAIETASQLESQDVAAWGWDYLSFVRRRAGKVAEAETAATEGFRLRKMYHLPAIESSYMNLGAIRAVEGDTASALVLLDEAEKALHLPTNRTIGWHLYMERGRVRLQAGQLELALDDLRRARELARVWRVDVVPNDENRTSAERKLAELYGLLIDAGNRLQAKTGDSSLIKETFEAAEENRAASLRAMVPQPRDWRSRLSETYWQALAKLHQKEAEWARTGPNESASLTSLRLQLAEMEASAGAPVDADRTRALDHVRVSLDSQSALFSFRLGEQESWIWVVTRDSIALHTAPSRKELAGLIAGFAEAVRTNSPRLASEGSQLFQKLFGSIAAETLAHQHWLLALEGELFELPFPALPFEPGIALIEGHSIQIVPGALMFATNPAAGARRGSFLGVADPIYNNADPRLRQVSGPPWIPLLNRAGFDQTLSGRDPGFARLWGTGREVENAARAWSGESSTILTGADASAASLWAASRKNPDIIHMATHILEENERLHTGWIVLSRSQNGQLEYLTPAQISARSVSPRLVVLSGCSSGKAEIRTASGLMGLTRAWIAAGAGSVLATRWPTVDDDGAFFESFYRNFHEYPQSGAAGALHRATLEMIHSETWRAKPSFWAGYFLVGNN
jgi:CHAT domain-containing protein